MDESELSSNMVKGRSRDQKDTTLVDRSSGQPSQSFTST